MVAVSSAPGQASPPPGTRGGRSNWTWVVLVAAVVFLAGCAGYYLGSLKASTTAPVTSASTLEVHVGATDSAGRDSSLSGAIVDAFSVVPTSLAQTYVGLDLSSLPGSSNPYFVIVGSGSTGANGNATLTLGSVFDSIESQWQLVAGPPTQNVSLEVDLTYVATQNGTASLYHGYSPVEYSPYLPFPALHLQVTLNLTDPDWTGPAARAPGVAGAGSCEPSLSANWSTVAFSVQHGALPLAMLIDNASGPGNDTALVEDFWGTYAAPVLALGSVQAGTPGIVQASTQPAWTGAYPDFYFEGGAAASYINTSVAHSMSLGSVYLEDVTYLIVGQEESAEWNGGTSCARISLNLTYVTDSIVTAATGLPACTAAGPGLACGGIFHSSTESTGTGLALEDLPNKILLNQTIIAPGLGVSEYDLLRGSANYSVVIAREASIANTAMVFPVDLGEAVLVADLSSGCDGSCIGSNSSNAADALLGAQFGPASSELASLGGLGYVIGGGGPANPVAQDIGYANNQVGAGTPLDLYLYGGLVLTYLNAGGSMLGAHLPEIGPLICPPGRVPGVTC